MPKQTSPALREEPIIRAVPSGPGLRAVASDGEVAASSGIGTLFGYGALFGVWTEIDSYYEGRFLEQISPGAFKKTIKERLPQIRCLFQHGYDPQIGDKPLGPFETLAEDETGLLYEVPLVDTSYNRDLIPGLEAGLYGSSFRMRVMRDEFVEEPGTSDHNPQGLPERTIKEIQLYELGPVTFPAYADASASVRSLTDHFAFERMTRDPERLRDLVAFVERSTALPAVADAEPAAGTETRDAGTSGDGATTTTSPSENTAPPIDDAGTRSHLIRGRRDDKRTPLLSGATPRKKEATSCLL